jgi:hypothetical protein
MPSDRTPHCAWTVIIDESYPKAQSIPALDIVARTEAATWELPPIDSDASGQADYSGPLLSDVDFGAFSHSALVRIADEVCLQMHLLNLSFGIAVRARSGDNAELATAIGTKQLTGIAGVAAERIRRALKLPADIAGLTEVLRVHPLLNPAGYVRAEIGDGRLHVRPSPAHNDGAWISLCSPASTEPLQAIATAVDPHLALRVRGTDTDWTAEFELTDTPSKESSEVAVTKFSLGATFEFHPRRSLPLTVL